MPHDQLAACDVLHQRLIYGICIYRDQYHSRMRTDHGQTAGKKHSHGCQIYGYQYARIGTFPDRCHTAVYTYRTSAYVQYQGICGRAFRKRRVQGAAYHRHRTDDGRTCHQIGTFPVPPLDTRCIRTVQCGIEFAAFEYRIEGLYIPAHQDICTYHRI